MVKNENTNLDAQITINVQCLRRPCKGGCLYGFEYEGAQPEHRAVARAQSRPRTAQSRHPLPHDTPHTMAVPAREGQTAAARAMAQEAAASLRTTAVVQDGHRAGTRHGTRHVVWDAACAAKVG